MILTKWKFTNRPTCHQTLFFPVVGDMWEDQWTSTFSETLIFPRKMNDSDKVEVHKSSKLSPTLMFSNGWWHVGGSVNFHFSQKSRYAWRNERFWPNGSSQKSSHVANPYVFQWLVTCGTICDLPLSQKRSFPWRISLQCRAFWTHKSPTLMFSNGWWHVGGSVDFHFLRNVDFP